MFFRILLFMLRRKRYMLRCAVLGRMRARGGDAPWRGKHIFEGIEQKRLV